MESTLAPFSRGPTPARLLWVTLMLMAGPALAQDGTALYNQWCTGCHQAGGQGIPGAFPPLVGNPRAQNQTYVVRVIQQGVSGALEVGGQTYNGAMPAMAQITLGEAQAIAAYVAGLNGTVPVTRAPAATSPTDPAMVEQGRAMFMGTIPLENGGAPCMACHNAGQTGGGSLGIDLTTAHTRLGGQAGLQAVLSAIAFPVMRASYQNHPLTSQEIEALIAYFASIASENPSNPAIRTHQLLWSSLGGMAVLFAGMGWWWRNRRMGLAERIRTTHRRKV